MHIIHIEQSELNGLAAEAIGPFADFDSAMDWAEANVPDTRTFQVLELGHPQERHDIAA